MQKQFLDRPLHSNKANPLQVEIVKNQKDFNKIYLTEKSEKRSATNKKRGGTMGGFNLGGATSSTPEK